MNSESLYYFSCLAKDLNMTRTARKLFITQQTLSNHIAALEEECGLPLFDRKPHLRLTYAGNQVLSFADSVLEQNRNLANYLADIKAENRGLIRIGSSRLRAEICLSSIFAEYYQSFPDVEFRVILDSADRLEAQVLSGALDIAVISVNEVDPRLSVHTLYHDKIFLCIPDALLTKYYGEEAQEKKLRSIRGASVQDFLKIPYCFTDNRMGQIIRPCFDSLNIVPEPRITVPTAQICMDLVFKQKLLAGFTNSTNLLYYKNTRGAIPEDINIFPLYFKDEPLMHHIAAVESKDRYQPKFMVKFMELLLRSLAANESISFDHLAM